MHHIIHGPIPPISHLTDMEATAPDGLDNRRVASCHASMSPRVSEAGRGPVPSGTGPAKPGAHQRACIHDVDLEIPTAQPPGSTTQWRLQLEFRLDFDAQLPKLALQLRLRTDDSDIYLRVSPRNLGLVQFHDCRFCFHVRSIPWYEQTRVYSLGACSLAIADNSPEVSGSAWVLRTADGSRPLPCAFSHLSFCPTIKFLLVSTSRLLYLTSWWRHPRPVERVHTTTSGFSVHSRPLRSMANSRRHHRNQDERGSMCISLEINNNTARFCFPPEYQACKAEFDRLHETSP